MTVSVSNFPCRFIRKGFSTEALFFVLETVALDEFNYLYSIALPLNYETKVVLELRRKYLENIYMTYTFSYKFWV